MKKTMRLRTTLTLIMGAMISAGALAGEETFVEDLSDGEIEGGWSYFGNPDNPIEVIENAGGNPGAFVHSTCEGLNCLDTFAPRPRTQAGVQSIFTGNYKAKGVTSVGIDLILFDVATTAAGRPLSIILRNDNGTPNDFTDDPEVWFVGSETVPLVGQGWKEFDLEIPSQSKTLPAGWKADWATQPDTPDDEIWDFVINDVDQVRFFYGDPEFFFIIQQWEPGFDNVRISGTNLGLSGIEAPAFMGVGDLDGQNFASEALGLASNAPVVVGTSQSKAALDEAFRWDPDGGIAGLGDLPGGSTFSIATDASGDGSVVVGRSNSDNGTEAFLWTEADGMIGLGDLPGNIFRSEANAVSDDGSTVVGWSRSNNSGFNEAAFVWTEDTGMVELGDLPGGDFRSVANDISADGSVIVGFGNSDNGLEAFRWTERDGMVGLGDLPGDNFQSRARGVSDDGSVVVGASVSDFGNFEAFRWTAEDGMVGLGDLPGGLDLSLADDANADGSIIVGRSRAGASDAAFIWDADNGMRDLKQVLMDDFGLDLTGWSLNEAHAISADGTMIAGTGTNPDGNPEGWIAVLPEPEPTPGDLDGDNVVGVSDLLILLGEWGPCPDQGECPADLDGDGTVGVSDLLELLSNWG